MASAAAKTLLDAGVLSQCVDLRKLRRALPTLSHRLNRRHGFIQQLAPPALLASLTALLPRGELGSHAGGWRG